MSVSFEGSSDGLFVTSVPSSAPSARSFYLDHSLPVEAPVIVKSAFVPADFVAHLLRRKKDSALGVKFVKGEGDRISNMDAALHTFVTPVCAVSMHGDHIYRDGRHGVVAFPPAVDDEGRSWQRARKVVLAATVQPDFETEHVMLRLVEVRDRHRREREVGWPRAGEVDLEDDGAREAYDERLRRCIIDSVMEGDDVPLLDEAKRSAISTDTAVRLIEAKLVAPTPSSDGRPPLLGITLSRPGPRPPLSLDLLSRCVLHQVRNELSALDRSCPQGFVYTWDPPSIFARHVGAGLLNRVHLLALKQLADDARSPFGRMRVFAYNDYAEPDALRLLRLALRSRPDVRVTSKADLFGPPTMRYRPPSGAGGTLLVVHNNSDGFGQNVETEGPGGSLDGAIGSHSSAAASLRRQNPSLLDRVVDA